MILDTTNIQKFQNRPINTIRLLAFLEAKKGKGDELWKILRELIEPTLAEPGNIAYVPHRLVNNSDNFMFDEIWEDQKDLDRHFKQPHMHNLEEKLSPLLEKPLELRIYYEIKPN
jgi:quinol monooxygenase YgiN